MKKILLVEDDPDLQKLMGFNFHKPDYLLHACKSAKEAYQNASENKYDLFILDVMLPDGNGISVCKTMREKDPLIPILMLTARSSESDKITAFGWGADDYVTKPFGILELKARVNAILRRADKNHEFKERPETDIHFRELIISRDRRKTTFRAKRLDLTPKESDLLFLLASNPGKSFSRTELLERVWGISFAGYEHTVTAHINRLRLKVEPNTASPEYILTSWGTGYRFAE